MGLLNIKILDSLAGAPEVVYCDRNSAKRNRYTNLREHAGLVNLTKGRKFHDKDGIGLLDCRTLHEYRDGHIAEDPATGILLGLTPSGKFHIRVLGINHPRLVDLRLRRTRMRERVGHGGALATITGDPLAATVCTSELRRMLAEEIPFLDEL